MGGEVRLVPAYIYIGLRVAGKRSSAAMGAAVRVLPSEARKIRYTG